MPKIKYSFRANKTNKEEHVDDTNQKNNWVVEKHGVDKQDFLDLRSKLFKNKGGALDLKDKEFYTFATIAYFFLDPQDGPQDETGDAPSDCIRVLRVFLQLKNRKYLDDVIIKLILVATYGQRTVYALCVWDTNSRMRDTNSPM